jgi:O-antigen ligase
MSFTSAQDTRLFLPQYSLGGGQLVFRATGFAGHPNMFGRECVLLFCVLLMMLISWRPKPFWRLVILGMLGLTAATIVFSLSRVAWGYFAVGAFGFLLIARRRWLIPFAVLTAIVILATWSQVWPRIQTILEGTDASLAVRARGGALSKTQMVPHEGYVFLLSSLGLIGLFLYIFVVFAVLRNALKVARDRLVRADPELKAMAGLGFALASVVAVNFVVGVEFSQNVWYLMGAALAASRIARSRIAQAEQNAVANASDG